MSKRRREPIRTCIACRQSMPKRELVRIVRSPDNQISIDKKGKNPGRGAYVCPRIECVDEVIDRNLILKTLGTSIDDQTADRLRQEINE